ncbi:hypothetical protein [Profundibacter sp.]
MAEIITRRIDTITLETHIGAKAAGNLLDGREWGQMPEVAK